VSSLIDRGIFLVSDAAYYAQASHADVFDVAIGEIPMSEVQAGGARNHVVASLARTALAVMCRIRRAYWLFFAA
jgi:hypothetical protein